MNESPAEIKMAVENELEKPASVLQVNLSPVAARVLGCLIEKEFATPDLYPLTLNALLNACNQRNNREPVMSLSEREVEEALDELRAQRLAVLFSGAESRVPKYKHKLEQVIFVDSPARAVLCELLVRGPQTAAALRGNAQRLNRMPEAAEFEEILKALSQHPAGELVRKLARQPGQKEARWTQLLAGEPAAQHREEPPVRSASPSVAELERRIVELEAAVQLLLSEVADLRREKA
jgi:uncharacterized protein YceH (UPF0502 family)